jgi:hypothetical protein
MKPQEVYETIGNYLFMSPQQRRAYFSLATTGQLKALEDACLNVLKNPRGLTREELDSLGPYREQIRVLSRKHELIATKRKVLTQRGRFLAILLPILSKMVASFMQQE